MSKPRLNVFLCTGKDCAKAWRRVCDGSPGKWLKRQLLGMVLARRLACFGFFNGLLEHDR